MRKFFIVLLIPSLSFAQSFQSIFPPQSFMTLSGGFRLLSATAPKILSVSLGGNYFISETGSLIDEDYYNKKRIITVAKGYHYSMRKMRAGVTAGLFLGKIGIEGILSSVVSTAQISDKETERNEPIHAVGDLIIGLKTVYSFENRDINIGFGMLGTVPTMVNTMRYRLSASRLRNELIFTYDFSNAPWLRVPYEDFARKLPIRVNVNLGYNIDETRNLSKAIGDVKYALLLRSGHQFNWGIGAELGGAEAGPMRNFSWIIEYYGELICDGGGISECAKTKRKFGENPHYLTLGFKFRPFFMFMDGIYLHTFLDILLSPKFKITEEIEGKKRVSSVRLAPPWAAGFGATFIVVPSEVKIETRAVEIPQGKIKGFVKDADTGAPIGDAIISFVGMGLANLATDPNTGKFETYPLPVGIMEFEVRREGYESARVSVRVEKGRTSEVVVKLSKIKVFGVLAGSVKSEKGIPVPAKITFPEANLLPVFTDPETGEFEINIIPGDYKMKIEAEGYEEKIMLVSIQPRAKTTVEIILESKEKPVEVLMPLPKPREEEVPTKVYLERIQGKIILAEKILFEYGTARILPISFGILDELAKFLKDNPDVTIRIEGHVDPIGTEEQDLILSEERAEAVMNYLIMKGTDPTRLEVKGYGSSRPIAPNDTPEGRAKNRRIEFIVTSPL